MNLAVPFYVFPVAYALFVWWFSTGVIIYLDNLPRYTHRWSLAAATVILAVALHRLHAISTNTTLAGAYAAFTYGLLVWGWQEMSFFMGFITGPVREPCPPDCSGWQSFVRALKACLYHELTSLAFGGVVVALSYHGANQVGVYTYMVLWLMRMSAKLNVLLGVRNLSEEFIPEHLAFIRSFLRQRSMNLLFPFSVTMSTVAAILLLQKIAAPGTGIFTATGTLFIAILMILAIIEHWFLVVPLPAAALWHWSLKASQTGQRVAGQQRGNILRVRRNWATNPTSLLPRLAPLSVPLNTQRAIGDEP